MEHRAAGVGHVIHASPCKQALETTPLPASMTALIGRLQELDGLTTLLREPGTRLVTVTGPGGVGKTRLGLEVASALGSSVDDFPDGAAWVSLGAVTEPDLVYSTVVTALGLGDAPDAAAFRRAMTGRRVLLVLDNFEHLMAAAPTIPTLLGECPGITALVTSRERLRVRGEKEFPLAPLRLPSETPVATPGDAAALLTIPAVALLVERVRDVWPEFSFRPENAAAAADICRRLDGLPLAIELAAARAKVLSLPALLARLERRLPLLNDGPRDQPARQQTLERTIAWSYDLLTPDEQTFFRHLAVFSGGFTLEAAEAMGRGVVESRSREDAARSLDPLSPRLLDAIGSLVDKSLLRQTETSDGEARFAFLETIREFGLGRLAEAGETEAARDLQARWVLDFAGSTWAERWHDPVPVPLLDRFELELGNLRAALEWLAETSDATGLLALNGLLAPYWIIRSYRAEGRSWAERGLALPNASEAPPDVLARASHFAAALARTHGDRERAIALAEQSRALYATLDDALGISASVNLLGVLERGRGNLDVAADYFAEAEARFAAIPGTTWLALARCNLGMVRLWQGNLSEARRLLASALAAYRAQGDAFGVAFTQHGLALVAGNQGDAAAAATILADVVRHARDSGWKEILIDGLFGAGTLAATAGKPEEAVRTLTAATTQADDIGYMIEAPERSRYDAATEAARSALAPAAWEAATAAGRSATLVDSAAAALDFLAVIATGQRGDPAVLKTQPGPLSPREEEVIRLIAAGMSDRQIGETLFISHRTAMRHVTNILSKLEVTSRGAAGAWYHRREGIAAAQHRSTPKA